MNHFSLNYATSIFNPLLKIVITFFYILVAYVYFKVGKKYGGHLKTIINILVWIALVGAVASFLRYLSHGIMLGFTEEYSLKWFQSLGYVIQAVLLAYAGKKFIDMAKI